MDAVGNTYAVMKLAHETGLTVSEAAQLFEHSMQGIKPVKSKMEIALDGPCKGHPCDNCKMCQSGHCCRRDNPNYHLPELGEWDGPIYGELGVLTDDGDRAQCHCCGKFFGSVQRHAWASHNLTAEEYKAIFGLSRRQGLTGPGTWRKRSESMKIHGSAWGGTPAVNTPEQLAQARSKPRRLQMRKKVSLINSGRTPHNFGLKHGGQSSYHGVSQHSTGWQVNIYFQGQQYYIGWFQSEEQAARAYDAKARELYGEKARLNFPD